MTKGRLPPRIQPMKPYCMVRPGTILVMLPAKAIPQMLAMPGMRVTCLPASKKSLSVCTHRFAYQPSDHKIAMRTMTAVTNVAIGNLVYGFLGPLAISSNSATICTA